MAKNKNKIKHIETVKEELEINTSKDSDNQEVKEEYIINNPENIDKAVEQIDSLIVAMEEVIVEDKEDIRDFIKSMKGKRAANPIEIDTMFKLYEKYTGKKETNKNCSSCIMRVYQILNKLVK